MRNGAFAIVALIILGLAIRLAPGCHTETLGGAFRISECASSASPNSLTDSWVSRSKLAAIPAIDTSQVLKEQETQSVAAILIRPMTMTETAADTEN